MPSLPVVLLNPTDGAAPSTDRQPAAMAVAVLSSVSSRGSAQVPVAVNRRPVTDQRWPSQDLQQKLDPAAPEAADVQAEEVLETTQISNPEADVIQFSLNVTSLPVSSDQPISELPGEEAASPGRDQAAVSPHLSAGIGSEHFLLRSSRIRAS